MKNIIFLIPLIILFLSACGDIEQVLSKNSADNNAAQNENSDNGGTNQGNGDSDNVDNSGSSDNTGGNEGDITESENPNDENIDTNPDKDNQGGDIVEPGEEGGDNNQGGEIINPNPDGDGNGETTVNPDKDDESGTDNTEDSETPAYNKEFNALTNVFEPKYYYGRSLLKSDEERNAYDLIMQTFITFDVNDSNANDKRIKVDFASNNIHVTNEQLNTIGKYILYDEQRLTYLITSSVPRGTANGSAGATTVDSLGYVTEAYYDVFAFNMTTARTLYDTQSALIEEGAENILSKLKSDMNEGQKFRVLHDEFIKTVSYGQQGVGVRDIRGGLGPNKKVLCEGYARTLAYLCQRAGLEVIYVVGTANYSGTGDDGSGGAFDHAWIKVKINGQWYNVDPTNNDSIVANSTTVLYNHFLMSDTEYDKDHTAGKTTNEVSPNTSYGTFPASAPVSYNKADTDYP